MGKYFFIFLFCFGVAYTGQGQDLVVTSKGDSLNCKIVFQSQEQVKYTIGTASNADVKELSYYQIKSIVRGFFEFAMTDPASVKSNLPKPVPPKQNGIDKSFDNTNDITSSGKFLNSAGLSFGLLGGLSSRLNRPMIGLSRKDLNYFNRLKSGFSVGLDGYYFFKNGWGVGTEYNLFLTNGRKDESNSDKIAITFLGASIARKIDLGHKRNHVLTAFWLGYQPYKNRQISNSESAILRAETMAWGISVGLEHDISPKLAINLRGSCFISASYKLRRIVSGNTELITLSNYRFENLSRAAITMGLRFR